MAVTLTSADKALKSLYLDVVSEQLNNNVSPFLAEIEKTSNDVWGKEIKKLAINGLNGGIGAGTEDGNLPTSSGNDYKEMTLGLKNLYGTIEISDKAIRASESNSGAFVNLLNAEMEGLIKSASFNFGRMLFGDGTGVLGTVDSISAGNVILPSVDKVFEGMVIDFRDETTGAEITGATGRKITFVDRVNKYIKVSGTTLTSTLVPDDSLITIQGSYNNEITGLGKIFSTSSTSLYGLTISDNPWLKPYIATSVGTISENKIQKAIDEIERNSGSKVNFIVCSWGVRRALQGVLSASTRNLDVLELTGGFKAMSYNGIPIVADRFCPAGKMYLLNTNDFALHQLCDWQWLEGDDGKVLKQVAGKPVYTATLVKYADLMCSRPNGQGLLDGITEA